MLKRALGYEYTEESIEISRQGRKVKQTIKHVAPDTAAAFIWLKNRRPDKWREKPDELYRATEVQDDGLFDAIEAAAKDYGKDAE